MNQSPTNNIIVHEVQIFPQPLAPLYRERLAKIVEALRSDRYKKARHAYKQNAECYCAAGAMLAESKAQGWIQFDWFRCEGYYDRDYYAPNIGGGTMLQDAVGIDPEEDSKFWSNSTGTWLSLYKLNDYTNLSLSEIADVLEACYLNTPSPEVSIPIDFA